ncbi:hypothetical protein PR048_020091 [Dryococelus australis]|uniref:Transmembrane protein n=1 Tax=Dryococelus australis TaxID=614101 RepID=A0ABQ9H5B5_9NEOP|nr:hypothetical protein PR048_020091 [Dryococelus australis]
MSKNIRIFPSYKSHYSRHRKYLPPRSGVTEMCLIQGLIYVFIGLIQSRLLQYTFNMKLMQQHLQSENKKRSYITDKPRKLFSKTEQDSSIIVFTFDLQKTLPTPTLTSNKIYYCKCCGHTIFVFIIY